MAYNLAVDALKCKNFRVVFAFNQSAFHAIIYGNVVDWFFKLHKRDPHCLGDFLTVQEKLSFFTS